MGIFPCLSCCGVSLSQSTGSSLICLPRKICRLELICYLNSVPAKQDGIGEQREGCGESQHPTWQAGKLEFFLLQWVCTYLSEQHLRTYVAWPFPSVKWGSLQQLDPVLGHPFLMEWQHSSNVRGSLLNIMRLEDSKETTFQIHIYFKQN